MTSCLEKNFAIAFSILKSSEHSKSCVICPYLVCLNWLRVCLAFIFIKLGSINVSIVKAVDVSLGSSCWSGQCKLSSSDSPQLKTSSGVPLMPDKHSETCIGKWALTVGEWQLLISKDVANPDINCNYENLGRKLETLLHLQTDSHLECPSTSFIQNSCHHSICLIVRFSWSYQFESILIHRTWHRQYFGTFHHFAQTNIVKAQHSGYGLLMAKSWVLIEGYVNA